MHPSDPDPTDCLKIHDARWSVGADGPMTRRGPDACAPSTDDPAEYLRLRPAGPSQARDFLRALAA
jgi:hypothetical protein